MVEDEKWHQANAHLSDPGQRLRAACATHMDDAVGQILAAVDRKGLRQKTLVLFFGDNGAHGPLDNQGGPYPGEYSRVQVGNTNAPLRGSKGGIYEGGIRTPALVHWPPRLAARDEPTPVHAVDWMPTFCALAGAAPAGDLKWDGTNVWPVVAGTGTLAPRTLYTAAPGFTAQAVRHSDWKLIVTHRANKKAQPGAPRVELFNLAQDRSETRNLAAEQPQVLAEMQARLAAVSARDKDAVASD
jgi:arylsulfatase A-like enzyme